MQGLTQPRCFRRPLAVMRASSICPNLLGVRATVVGTPLVALLLLLATALYVLLLAWHLPWRALRPECRQAQSWQCCLDSQPLWQQCYLSSRAY